MHVKTQEKADKLLARFRDTLDQEITLLESYRRLDEDTRFDALVTSPLNQPDVSTAVFETLQIASRIANQWVVMGPYESAGNQWEFHGILSANQATKIPGITWIGFTISNSPIRAIDAEHNGTEQRL
jgi:hypothetical protein